MDILTGDTFSTENPMALGKIINANQWLWSRDNEAIFSHSGILMDNVGTTFEALWTVKSQNLFQAYKKQRVIIARPKVPMVIKQKALDGIIEEHKGKIYPLWRLGLHILPPLAKISIFKKHLVCSEITAKYEYYCGVRHKHYPGATPDTLVDEWRKWKDEFEIVFDGIL